MGQEKKRTTQFKKKELRRVVATERAVQHFKEKDKKRDLKKAALNRKSVASKENDMKMRKEVEAFLMKAKDKGIGGDSDDEDFMTTTLVDSDSDGILDFSSSDNDSDVNVMDFDDDGEGLDVDDASDDDDDEDEDEEDGLDLVDEDDYDDQTLLFEGADDDDEDDDEDAMAEIDDDYNDIAASYGGVVQNIDDFSDDDEDDMDEEVFKQQLEYLKKSSPQDYKDLKNTYLAGAVDDDEDVLAVAKHKAKKSFSKTPIETLTKESYLALRKPFDDNTFTSKDVLNLVRMFKSAVVIRRAPVNAMKEKKSEKQVEKIEQRFVILMESKIYNHFLQFALRTIPTAMVLMLNRNSNLGDSNPKGSLKDACLALSEGPTAWAGTSLKSLSGWKNIAPMARAYFLSITSLLIDEMDPMILRFIMRTMLPAVPMLEEVTHPAPKILKNLLRIWSLGADIAALEKDENGASKFGIDNASRIDAFLVIRRMCLTMPPRSQVLEATMKGIYLSFVRVAKHVHSHSVSTISFLCNCITEVYGIDVVSAYQHAFVYIRQLAIHLRSAILKPTEESIRSVYNWQFINSLRVWAQVLSTHASNNSSSLFPLVYPFLQVALGVMELSSSPTYFPVRFHVAQYINEIGESTKLYVPLASHLLSVFNANIMKDGKTKASDAKTLKKKAVDIKYKLHVSQNAINSTAFKDLVLNRTIQQLTYHLSSFSQSIAFPEICLPIKFFLKKFSKETGIFSAAKAARQLLSAINENSQFIIQRRQKVTFSPRDLLAKGLSGIDTFKYPTLVASLNQQVNQSKFAGMTPGQNKTGGVKASPIEVLWKSQLDTLKMEEREEVVVAAQDKNEELDNAADDDDNGDDDVEEYEEDDDIEDDIDDEDDEHIPSSYKRMRDSDSDDDDDDVDLDDIEEVDDEVEDFILSDDEEEVSVVVKKPRSSKKLTKKQKK